MRILILRTSALGDVVHALPVLNALHRHLPEAEIGWVVEAPFLPILEGHPALHRLFPVRLKAWRRSLGKTATRREMYRALGEIRRFRADIALDLMGNHKAGALAWLSGARRRIGLTRPFRREPSSRLWINEAVPTRGDHAVERALSVLDALGLPREEPDFGPSVLMPETPETTAALPAVPDLSSPSSEGPLVLLCPGAGWGNKEYPPTWWGRVAAELHQKVRAITWIPSGPGEEGLGETVAQHSGGAAHPLGLVDLPTLATLMRRARLVLAGDTGPLHLAHALGTPVVAVLGPTDPRRHGPYGDPQGALAVELPCSFCYQRLPEAKACLLAIPPRRVVERALERLAQLERLVKD